MDMVNTVLRSAMMLWVGLAICIVVFGAGEQARACPMCSESLSSGSSPGENPDSDAPNSASGSLAEGFYYSILLMLAVPFSMAGGLGGALYLNLRKSDNNRQEGPPPPESS